MRGQTERRYWLFWDLGSCYPMVHSADCYDLGYQNEINLCPMLHNSSFHPWMGQWNYLCPSNFGKGDEVLCLKCTLYGLKRLPWYFFHYLTEHIIKQRLKALQFDPCLFISKLLIVMINVDDILIYGRSDAEINDLNEGLKHDEIMLHHKGTAEGYLGVNIPWDGNQITLLQEGLTKQIIATLGLDSKCTTPVNTPADAAALGWDVDGKEPAGASITTV
jgi:hypothetical protein